MKLVGLLPVRNEAYVLGLSARVALMWCDELVIGLHACTDASPDIAMDLMKEYPGRVVVCSQPEAIWDEMTQRQRLLVAARQRLATHIAVVDADEIISGNLLQQNGFGQGAYFSDGDKLEGRMLQLPLYNLRGGINRFHANGLWGNRVVSLAFKDDPALHWGGDRFHQREPQGKRLQNFCPVAQGEGGVMHLWCSSEERCRQKHRAYKIHEALRWPDKDHRDIEFMYNQWERGGLREDPAKWTFADVPESWLRPYEHLLQYLDIDAEPWQKTWCDDMIERYGRERFKGLSV